MKYENRKERICKICGMHLPTVLLWFRNVTSYSEKKTMILRLKEIYQLQNFIQHIIVIIKDE
jgi:hypothetical protein